MWDFFYFKVLESVGFIEPLVRKQHWIRGFSSSGFLPTFPLLTLFSSGLSGFFYVHSVLFKISDGYTEDEGVFGF